MASSLINFLKTNTNKIKIGFFSLILLSIASSVFGGSINVPIANNREGFNVYGFAWMGGNIETTDEIEGGGGWLKLNCEPEHCNSRSPWGVKLKLNSRQDEGLLSGEGWSNNYGFLSFNTRDVRSCWATNPSRYNHVAKVIDINLDPNSIGFAEPKKVVGWAKFIAGDEVSTDGWDGCVNFHGNNYGVFLDLVTGDLTGWAWGSEVVGYISFKTPECKACNTFVLLPGNVNINFWAEDEVVPEGGETTLRWQEISSTPQRKVASCSTYSNSSNYPHWISQGGASLDSSNVGTISTERGNLPSGSHPIAGLNQTTTYTLSCVDSSGVELPEKTTTVVVSRGVQGCMDPLASNYNPRAIIPGECIYGSIVPTVNLNIITNFPPNFLPVGSATPFDYQLSPRWTFTNPNRVDSCTGSFFDENGDERTLTGWTNSDLATPTINNGFSAGPYSGTNNVEIYATLPDVSAGDMFNLKINCIDIEGNPFGDDAQVIFQNTIQPIPSINLEVEEDIFTVGSGNYNSGLVSWTGTNTGQINTCSGRFAVNGVNQTLSGWTGTRSNPPSSISNFNLTSIANNATAGTVFRFTLSCQLTSGETISAQDTIIMQSGPVDPPAPLPVVDLRITSPNNAGGPDWEELTNAGATVNFSWSVQNAESCTGTSSMLNQGPNNSWNSGTYNPVSGSRTMDMTSGSPYYYPSLFTLTCVNEDDISASDSVNIVIDGIPCPPGPPECDPAPGSNIPGYEEF